jgi:hypothetical protein
MQAAYTTLKKKQNAELYGSDWLFANPNPFRDTIQVKLIGQINGDANLLLQDENGNVIKTISLTTEEAEVYDTSFIELNNLLPGKYFVKYSDSLTIKTIVIAKAFPAMKDWITAIPVPFMNQLIVYVKPQQSEKAYLRLIDISGRIIETKELIVSQGDSYAINFTSAASLAKGVYFVQYLGAQKKTIKVVK